MLGGDQRRQLVQDELGDGDHAALTLEEPRELGQVGLEPVLLGVLLRGVAQVGDHLVDVVLEVGDLAAGLDADRTGQVALGDGGGHLGDGPHLAGEVRGQLVDVVGEVLPGAGGSRHIGLAAQLALDADLASDRRHLVGEGGQRVDHAVDGLGQGGDLALGLHGQLLLQVAIGHAGDHLGDAAHLVGQVTGHEVHVVGQVLPGTGDAPHLGLAAQLAVGAHLAGHAGHFRGEGVELVHHDVDRVLQLQDLALGIDGDLLGQVALRDRRRHLGDVADLSGQVATHAVDVLGQVLPDAGDAGHHGLAAQLAVGAHLAGHAGDLRGERPELVHHRVDRVLELEELAPDVDGDLLGQVAVGDGDRHIGDVADLAGEVGGHAVDALGQVLPGAADPLDVGLAAQLALRAHLAGHAGHFRGERVELVHHDVDRVLQLEDLALGVDGDLLRQVAASDGGGDLGDVADLSGEVGGHAVDVVGQVLPGAADALDVGLAAQLALRAHLAGHAADFRGERVELVHHDVDRVLQLEDLALGIDVILRGGRPWRRRW